jgi:TfoX/Sxy family transcriptional regulator of competence genes
MAEGGMKMPKPSEGARAAFSGVVPDDPSITLKPMFGNLAAFVNGNMFSGLFGEDLFVRLPDDEAAQVKRQGGRPFEPMPGHAMSGYVMVPASWQKKPESVRAWVVRALALTREMPAKAKKPTKAAAKKPAARPKAR